MFIDEAVLRLIDRGWEFIDEYRLSIDVFGEENILNAHPDPYSTDYFEHLVDGEVIQVINVDEIEDYVQEVIV